MRKTTTLLSVSILIMLSLHYAESRSDSAIVHAEEGAKWVKTEIPLAVHHLESGKTDYGYARAEGFWQSTSSDRAKQLIGPLVVNITCYRDQKVCREADASVELGILKSALVEYDISSWSDTGIVADDSDEGACGIGHRLAVSFKSNSVVVTDYPKQVNKNDQLCKAFQDANSYSLHGGQLTLNPPAAWDPLAKR